jgi:hypothetical protein
LKEKKSMKRHLVKLVWVAALGLAGLTSTKDAEAKEMNGWRIEGSGSQLMENQKYSIFNLDQNAYWGYKDRAGANFGWDSAPNNGMMVKRKTAGSGPIKCGEIFAIFIEKEWVIREGQTTGISLSSRTKLAQDAWYQWKFTNCKDGDPVALNKEVTLTNTVEQDAIVGCKRVWGVNLCWADDVVTVRGKNYRRADAPR